jgi:RHS repeat-associated protein
MSSEWTSEEETINGRLDFEIRALVAIGVSSGHAEGSPQPGDTNITIYKWNETSALTAVTGYRTCSEYVDASGSENGSTHALDWNPADAQGAVRDVAQYSDDATTPDNHLVYDSFGQVYSQPPDEAANLSSLAFDGMWQGDAATALNYEDYRWYDAVDGVFASQDPLGFGGGQTNTEAFVGNSPTNFTDPLGLCDCGCPSQSDPYSPVGLEEFGGSGGYVPVCFAAGTSVLLADGTTKPIERIERGDKVRAAFHEDPEGTISDAEVVEVYHHGPRNLVEVEIGGHVIRATPKHPFYVRDRGWSAAVELRSGDELRTADGGWTAAGSVVANGHVEPVFNIQVAGLHTYFVRNGAGTVTVLVHNDSGDSGVTLNLNPTKPDSMKWTRAKLPPNIGGRTTVVPEYSWHTQTSNTGTVRVRYTIRLVATIQLDPANIAMNNKLTIETAYGHEQLHVKNAISILQQAKTKLATVANTEYDSQADAEAAAKKHCKQAQDWVQKRLDLDKHHHGKDPKSPMLGKGEPPIGEMPKGQ